MKGTADSSGINRATTEIHKWERACDPSHQAAAAYRAFRIRSYESALMMTAALIVMCGQMSFTLRIYEGFSVWRDWLMNVPNTAAFRAIRIGAAVAGLVLAFRMWFSIESQSFSEKK